MTAGVSGVTCYKTACVSRNDMNTIDLASTIGATSYKKKVWQTVWQHLSTESQCYLPFPAPQVKGGSVTLNRIQHFYLSLNVILINKLLAVATPPLLHRIINQLTQVEHVGAREYSNRYANLQQQNNWGFTLGGTHVMESGPNGVMYWGRSSVWSFCLSCSRIALPSFIWPYTVI